MHEAAEDAEREQSLRVRARLRALFKAISFPATCGLFWHLGFCRHKEKFLGKFQLVECGRGCDNVAGLMYFPCFLAGGRSTKVSTRKAGGGRSRARR